jgi:hypothetical protein
MVPDVRVFSSIKNEQKYPWLYDSVVHQGYLCKFCELFCSHSSSSQEFVTVKVQYDCYSITGHPNSQRQAETSLKIEDMRFNKTTGKLPVQQNVQIAYT